MIRPALSDRVALDRVFSLIASAPDLDLDGCLRVKGPDGTIEVWIRRGPLLFYGASSWIKVYCVVPWDGDVVVKPREVPATAVDLTIASGPWPEIVAVAIQEIVAEVERKQLEVGRTEDQGRLEQAQHELWRWRNMAEHAPPRWVTNIKRGRDRK